MLGVCLPDVGGGRCYSHGGGKRCQAGDCPKSDAGRGYCMAHGGGRRCRKPGCEALQLRLGYCRRHFEQPRCHFTECPETAAVCSPEAFASNLLI